MKLEEGKYYELVYGRGVIIFQVIDFVKDYYLNKLVVVDIISNTSNSKFNPYSVFLQEFLEERAVLGEVNKDRDYYPDKEFNEEIGEENSDELLVDRIERDLKEAGYYVVRDMWQENKNSDPPYDVCHWLDVYKSNPYRNILYKVGKGDVDEDGDVMIPFVHLYFTHGGNKLSEVEYWNEYYASQIDSKGDKQKNIF